MSDIREQIDEILKRLQPIREGIPGIERELAVNHILDLMPSWQSFSEAKPEEGEEIWVKSPFGDPQFWGGYLPMDLEELIRDKMQWLRIPE